MSTESLRYAAFISYRHMPRDRRWAIRIMQLLETYRTPAALQQQAFPDRIGHLFRDEDEIPASSDLSDKIKSALACSDYLIVVCSPDTSGSRWVRREIELFQELGKGERIIPLLIAGEPEQSFPEELRRRRVVLSQPDGSEEVRWEEVEPIAADVRPRKDERAGKIEHRAVLRLAAALLGCRYDDLAQREAERQRRRRRRQIGGAATAALLLLCIGLGWWDANRRIKTEYCANYSERWAVPQCVGPLSSAQQHRRETSYRIRSQGGRVLDMARINGSGGLVGNLDNGYETEPWTAGVAQWLYPIPNDSTPGTSKLVTVVKMSAPNGKLIRAVSYEFNGSEAIARFDRSFGVAERQAATGSALGAMLGSLDGENRRSSIVQHRLHLDTQGRITRRDFEPAGGGASIPDAVGVYGRAYDYSPAGLVSQTRNLDALGNTLIEKSGVAAQARDYDAKGGLVGARWLNSKGEAIANELQYAQVQISRDGSGNLERADYLDSANHATERSDLGFALKLVRHDARGNVVEESYLAADGKPVLRKDLGAARMSRRYDERGNEVEGAYFGIDNQPVLRKDLGAARMSWRYDERGNRVESAYFGIDNQPVLRKDLGAARMSMRYDERGNIVEEAYFGIDNQPVLSKDWGAARMSWRYDERGNQVEAAFFGIDNQPVLIKNLGAARMSRRYDERGNEVEQAYFGIDNQPVLIKNLGAARMSRRYDERGNIVEEAFFGIDNQPVLRKDWGAARMSRRYDERGNIVEEAFFGIDNQPVLRKDWGAARLSRRYDERGNNVEQAYFGVDGRPIMSLKGVARMTLIYNAGDEVVGWSSFDADGHVIETYGKGTESGGASTTGQAAH